MASIDEKLGLSSVSTLRYGVIRNLVLLVLVAGGAIVTVFLFGSYSAVNDISDRAIQQSVEHTEVELDGFFAPVESQAQLIQRWGEEGELILDYDEIETLNRRLLPVVESLEQVSSVLLADTTGREYMLLRDRSGWLNRFVDIGRSEETARWIRWDAEGNELDRWEEETDYRTRDRPWYQGAMGNENNTTFWTEPYTFFTSEEPGMTMSRRFSSPQEDVSKVVAFDVTLTEISRKTAAMAPTTNGYNAVLTQSGEVLGLPRVARYEDGDAISVDVLSSWQDLELMALGEAWERWRDSENREANLQGRSDEMGRYWAGFGQFELGDQVLTVATVVPRRDLTEAIDRQRNLTLGFLVLAVFAAAFIGFRTSRRYERKIASAYDDAKKFGQYHLQEKLGVGGMGEVYRAEHAMLKRPTAVKLLKPELYDRESIKRFEREVKLSCRLTHPNTVTIFDYGRTDDGLFYYAMELLEGMTFFEFYEFAGPLDEGRVVHLMHQVCGALAEAHEVGLIHRDVKPSNIMISNSAGIADRVTVLDFGLVKDLHSPIDEPQLTDQDYLHGSPGFMAPEVILGEKANTPSVDIFAVGAVAYTLLCGRQPFDGESPVTILMAQVEEDPPVPSQVLDREVDADLESWIMDCLQKKAEDRPRSMSEAHERLLACQSARSWTTSSAKQWWKEFGDEIVDLRVPPETERGSKAFEITVSVTQTGVQRDTFAAEPKSILGDEPTEEAEEVI